MFKKIYKLSLHVWAHITYCMRYSFYIYSFLLISMKGPYNYGGHSIRNSEDPETGSFREIILIFFLQKVIIVHNTGQVYLLTHNRYSSSGDHFESSVILFSLVIHHPVWTVPKTARKCSELSCSAHCKDSTVDHALWSSVACPYLLSVSSPPCSLVTYQFTGDSLSLTSVRCQD